METRREWELSKVMEWVSERLRYNDVPRVNDIYQYSLGQDFALSKKEIAQQLRLHPAYAMNMPQQRQALRSQKNRPIVVNSLGHLHADIGKFAIVKEYPTPVTYRPGYLVAKDVLSRFVYVSLLRKDKSAEALVKAFEDILRQHEKRQPGYRIVSISFDKEPSVMSSKVQKYFGENSISFHAFAMSSSKAKAAEGAIRQIRTYVARMMRLGRPKDRWWNLLQDAANSLNSRPVLVDGKNTGYAPKDITPLNLYAFLSKLQKLVPSYYFSQFDISPRLVNFKYEVGALVRPKLIVTSSAVLGQKRSEVNLSDEVYEVAKQIAFVTRRMTLGRAYKCLSRSTGEAEVFEEDDLALASENL